MTNAGIPYLSIPEAAAGLRSRQYSPLELTRACLERIEALDGGLHSFTTVSAQLALSQAQRAEQELGAGIDRGPLHGIPIAVKDVFATKGIRTTCNSVALQDWVPNYDATIIELLAAAGAVLLGKNGMYEFAFGTSTDVPFPAVRNPWSSAHIPGGSSSGSGAALAAGFCYGAIGSDTGGSIRAPSSYCGVVGVKPTYGRVSRHGLVPLSWSLDCGGPMARGVEDCALLLQAIAGSDAKDNTSASVPVPDYSAALRDGIKDLRIGVPRSNWFDEGLGVDPETETVFAKALKTLEDLGAKVVELDGRPFAVARQAYQLILIAEGYTYHRKRLRESPPKVGRSVRRKLLEGAFLTASDYIAAQRARTMLGNAIRGNFERVDVFATPTMAYPPPTFASSVFIGENVLEQPSGYLGGQPNFTNPFSLTGLPALSVPCGFTPDGLPVGLQIVAPPFAEATAFRCAHTYEQATEWHDDRPTF